MTFADQRVLTLSFPISGVVTTLLGPLLPVLIARWSLTDAQAGQLFLVQFLSSTAGAICSVWIMARAGIPRSIAASYALMGMGVLALGLVSRFGGLLCVTCYGFALGVSIPAINLLAGARSTKGRAVAQLNLLNMAWCLGAVLASPVIAFLIRTSGLGAVLGLISSVCLLSAIACLLLLSPAGFEETPPDRQNISRATRGVAIAAGFFLFLYVGTENGLNGWLPLFGQRTGGAESSIAAVTLSFFWTGILLARMVTASASHRLNPHRWILGSLVLATIGIGTLISVDRAPALLMIGAAAAGLGLGPVFPTAVAIFQDRAGAASGRLIGFVFAAAGCGGGALPWLIGALSTTSGSLRTGLTATLAAAVGMMLALRFF